MVEFHRGDIFSVNFDPVQGSEQGRVRPAVLIQNDVGNRYSPTLIVAAITSRPRAHLPVQVEVRAPEGGLESDSVVLLNQIRTIDKARAGRYWGRLGPETMDRVDRALQISLGLVPL